jgi:hypothetical protein
MYKAVLRDFIRSTGYPARQIEPHGIHADQTLDDMLRAAEVRHVLGDQHADMVTYFLGDPEHGLNLRTGSGRSEAAITCAKLRERVLRQIPQALRQSELVGSRPATRLTEVRSCQCFPAVGSPCQEDQGKTPKGIAQ